jgi:hypothetical protein
MLDALAMGLGLRRAKLKDAFREARVIDALAELDLDAPSPAPPSESVLGLARRRWRKAMIRAHQGGMRHVRRWTCGACKAVSSV